MPVSVRGYVAADRDAAGSAVVQRGLVVYRNRAVVSAVVSVAAGVVSAIVALLRKRELAAVHGHDLAAHDGVRAVLSGAISILTVLTVLAILSVLAALAVLAVLAVLSVIVVVVIVVVIVVTTVAAVVVLA